MTRTTLLAAAFALTAAVASAQPSFSDAQLDAFGHAVARASAVAQAWRPRVEAAGTDDERMQLVEQANTEIAQTIDQTDGLSLEDYEAIVVAMRTDADLAQRVERELQERGKGN